MPVIGRMRDIFHSLPIRAGLRKMDFSRYDCINPRVVQIIRKGQCFAVNLSTANDHQFLFSCFFCKLNGFPETVYDKNTFGTEAPAPGDNQIGSVWQRPANGFKGLSTHHDMMARGDPSKVP